MRPPTWQPPLTTTLAGKHEAIAEHQAMTSHAGRVDTYMDGSKTDHGVGAAAAWPTQALYQLAPSSQS